MSWYFSKKSAPLLTVCWLSVSVDLTMHQKWSFVVTINNQQTYSPWMRQRNYVMVRKTQQSIPYENVFSNWEADVDEFVKVQPLDV